jgi:excisionase family DNA binding protein
MPTVEKMPLLLTCREVADALRVEDSTVYRWPRTGVVDSVRIAGTVRIPASEFERITAPGSAPQRA